MNQSTDKQPMLAEVGQQTQPSAGEQAVLTDKEVAKEAIAKAKESLGHVASGRLLYQDESGNLLTDADRKRIEVEGTADDRRI